MGAEIHILFGEDDYTLKESFRALRDLAVPPDLWDGNGVILDGQKLTPEELQSWGAVYPFLAAKRMVVIEGFLSRFERGVGRSRGRADSGDPPASRRWSKLPELLEGLPPTTVVGFLEGRLSRDNPILKLLRPMASAQEFPRLRGANLSQWVRERSGKLGLTLSRPAQNLLIDLVGADLWAMSAELEKLSTYRMDGPIEEEEVRQLVAQAREINVFNMLDSLLAGRKPAALSQLRQLLDEGEQATRILTLLAYQIRLLIQLRALQEHRLSQDEMQSRLGIAGFRLRRAQEQAAALGKVNLEKAYEKLLEADLKIKTGVYPDDLALFLLSERLWEN